MSSAGDYPKAISLLRTMMDPQFQRVDVAPDVGTSSVASFVGNIDYSLTFNVAANSATVPGSLSAVDQIFYTDIVPFNRGMYISYPQYGVDRVFHYGFVDAGAYVRIATSTLKQNLRGLRLDTCYSGAKHSAASGANYVGYQLTFNAELGLPRVGTGVGFQIEPELEPNYSKLRAIASKMVMSSTTISGTNFNLSGTFSTGVIADTRDICQVVGANGVARAFPVAALSQQSITKGDVLRTSSVAEGVVELTGPDYARYWTQPKNDAVDIEQAQWQRITIANTFKNLFNLIVPAGNAYGTVYDGFQYCVTPWDLNFSVSNGSSGGYAAPTPTNYERCRTTAIPEDGILDIDFFFTPQFGCNDPLNYNLENNLNMISTINAVHVYAYAGANGYVNYNTVGETVRVSTDAHSLSGINGATFTTNIGAQTQQPVKVQFRPQRTRPGFAVTDGGKYLCTLISTTHQLATLTTGASFNPAGSWTGNIADVRIYASARTADAEGRVGIAHCVRYDDVTEGQQLQFQGSSIIQGIAQGKLQPFVQRAVGTITIPDTSLNKLLDLLWGRSPMFRRICTLREYRERIVPFISDLTPTTLKEVIDRLEPDDRLAAMVAASAAGLFGSIGKGLGSLFGLGDAGEALGGIGDKILGTGSGTFDQRPWSGKSETQYMVGNELASALGRRQRD